MKIFKLIFSLFVILFCGISHGSHETFDGAGISLDFDHLDPLPPSDAPAVTKLFETSSTVQAAPPRISTLSPEEMCSLLSKDFQYPFSVLINEENRIHLISKNGRIRVDWWLLPQAIFEYKGLTLFKTRFYNAGRGLSAYYLLIEGLEYRIYFRETSTSATLSFTAPDSHVGLIRAWLSTFKDPSITSFFLKETK